MKAYSPDLRSRILAAVDAGAAKATVARRFGVSRATVKRYVVLRRETGSITPRPRTGRQATLDQTYDAALWAQLVAHPDALLADHCHLWSECQGMTVSVSTMCRAIRRLGWTRKKRRWVPPSATRPAA
jgi:transposase